MSKFKVGDRVRYVGTVYRHLQGGVITRIDDDYEYPYSVYSESGTGNWPCSEDELKLVEVSDD